MPIYLLTCEDLWQGRWQPIGPSVTVDAETADAAVTRITRVPVGAGATYRICVDQPGHPSARTEPIVAPALPTRLAAASRTTAQTVGADSPTATT